MKKLWDKKLWDIFPPVDPASPVFPGDTPCTQAWAATLSDDCPVNVSAITCSPHVGANADAPWHDEPIALPLKLMTADTSPVRAVLREL